MSTTQTNRQPRKPRGIPTGGQYDQTTGGGAAAELGEQPLRTWDLRNEQDAREAHAELSKIIRGIMHWAYPDDREDAVSEAMVAAMESPVERVSPAYLRRLARAAVARRIAGESANADEHVARAELRSIVDLTERQEQRTLSPSEIHDLAQQIAAGHDRSTSHRTIAPDFHLRLNPMSLQTFQNPDWESSFLPDPNADRDVNEGTGDDRVDPLEGVVDYVELLEKGGAFTRMSHRKRQMIGWRAFAARYDAPYPAARSLNHHRRLAAVGRVRAAGGPGVLAADYRPDLADTTQYQAFFQPWGPTTEPQREAIVDALCDAGSHAEDLWTACMSTATFYPHEKAANRALANQGAR